MGSLLRHAQASTQLLKAIALRPEIEKPLFSIGKSCDRATGEFTLLRNKEKLLRRGIELFLRVILE